MPAPGYDLKKLPDSPDMLSQLALYMSNTLAQAAGIEIAPHPSDPAKQNIEIDSWGDWVRLISGFRDLATWHELAWDWAWHLKFGVYQRPFVAIAARGAGKSSTAEQVVLASGARGSRKYVLYVRATQAQANASIANIAGVLENSAIKDYYPLMGERLISPFGQSKGWNRTMVRTASGFTVAAFGLDSALRGSKVDDYRPDLICHQVGTDIYDPSLRRWCKVEDHPGLITLIRATGMEITISGAPESEVVTCEHRYWARHLPNKSRSNRPKDWAPVPDWVQAKDLRRKVHYIGMPIDKTEVEPKPIPLITLFTPPNSSIPLVKETLAVPPEFNDPEWWWFFGLWWRRGGFELDWLFLRFQSRTHAGPVQRALALLERYGIAVKESDESRPSVDGGQHNSTRIMFKHTNLFRWLRSWTNIDRAHRSPPLWVEQLRKDFQKQLLIGYLDLDNHKTISKRVLIFKEYLDDFLCLRRIMARLGIPAVVYVNKRKTSRPYQLKEYALYARDGVRAALGVDIEPSRAPQCKVFIADGHLWSIVESTTPVDTRLFAPIKTKTHKYLTHFGLSHNCLDDIDEKHDSPAITSKKIETITKSILPAGSVDMTVFAIQNKILDDGVFARLADGTADFLADRQMVGPIPAVEDLQYIVVNNIPRITGGLATWSGQSIEVCEQQMRTWGVRAFLAEAQHLTSMPEGGTFDGLVYTHMREDELPEIKEKVCWIDPAVSSTTRSDCQAIQIDGIERIDDPRRRPRIFRFYSWEGIDSPSNALKRALREGCARGVSKIGVETNQGGDLWEDEYLTIAGDMLDNREIDYIPKFDSAKAGGHTGSKEDRAGRMLTDYTRGYVVHVEGTHEALELALGRFPLINPDDLVDAAYWAWNDLRSRDKYRGKPRFVRVPRNKIFGNRATGQAGTSRAGYLRRLGLVR
jgi:hypothetical protein